MQVIRITTNVIGGTVFVLGVLVLTLLILGERSPGVAKAITEARCQIGVPAEGSRCVGDQIAALRASQEEMARKNSELEERLRAQKAREDELAALSAKVSNFSLFETETLGFGTVTTGVRFSTVLRPEEWSSAWCYTERTVKGLARRIAIGDQDADKPIIWHRVSDAVLQDAGLTRAQLEQAKAACHFPEMP